MVYEYVASSEKGSGRDKNEDRIMINDTVISEGVVSGVKENSFIAVICDGVGGMDGGEIAAEMVSSGFIEYDIDKASAFVLNNHLKKLNASIINEQKKRPEFKHMASTVAGIIILDNRFLLFNLGDTRIYETKAGSMLLKSKDHTAKIECLEDNRCVQHECLTGYIGGYNHACNPNIIIGHISDDEGYFLVCSDGIYKRISEDALRDILLDNSSLEDKRRAILNLSFQNGSTDDKSIVLIRYST